MNYVILIFFFLITACQGSDLTEEAFQKRNNQKGEYILRTHDQVTPIPPMEPLSLAVNTLNGPENLSKITKEYFRCKGSSLNTSRTEIVRGEVVKYHDCAGSTRHSLPLREGKEWIYPIFIDLANFIQQKTGKRVVITSGHRCPDHNTYVDPSPVNQYSKHQVGAEMDFYVQGMEDKPEKIIELIFDYYKTHPKYKEKKEFTEFKRYEKTDTNVTTKPWMNKEVFIKLFRPKEGRNYDNRHPYPYISLQIRYDTEKNEKVTYSWENAFRNFLRY